MNEFVPQPILVRRGGAASPAGASTSPLQQTDNMEASPPFPTLLTSSHTTPLQSGAACTVVAPARVPLRATTSRAEEAEGSCTASSSETSSTWTSSLSDTEDSTVLRTESTVEQVAAAMHTTSPELTVTALPHQHVAMSRESVVHHPTSSKAVACSMDDTPPSNVSPLPMWAAQHRTEGGGYQRAASHPSAVTQVLALVERACRQLWRQKLDFVVEVLLTFAFVFLAMALWGSLGTEKLERERYYGRNWSLMPSRGERSLDNSFDCCYDNSVAPCYFFPPELEDTIFSNCRRFYENVTVAIQAGLRCDGDMTHSPIPNATMCITDAYKNTSLSAWHEGLDKRLLSVYMDTTFLPTFDGILQLQWYALATGAYGRQQALPAKLGLTQNTRYNAVLCSGNLFFVGEQESTAALIAYFRNNSVFFPYVSDGKVYATVEDARAASAGGPLWSIVEVRQMDAGGLDLVLHMNSSALPSFGTTYDKAYSGGNQFDTYELYVLSGFLTLQQMVSQYYLDAYHSLATPELTYFGPLVSIPYTRSAMLTHALDVFSLMFALVFVYTVSQQAKRIVQERELRLREAMLIMGLRQWTLYVCELLVQVLVLTLACALITVMLRLTFVTKSDPLILFLLFWLFALTTVPLSGLIAAFLNHAEHAALVAPVVYIALLAPMVATSNMHGAVVTGLGVFSPSAFAAAMRLFMTYESGGGCGAAELRAASDDPSLAVLLAMLAGDFAVYYVLMLYADAVVPKQWGTARHPLFFVVEPARWLCGCGARAAAAAADAAAAGRADGRAADGVFEESDAAEDVVCFVGLRKAYARGGTRFVAVDNLCWGLRGGEISVLVGHNGAGKTTVLSMVTGMVAADGGDCYVYGASVRRARDAVRGELGYCPQHNILWGELTCRDHLEFYAKIKGLRGWELEDAVCRMLHETDLLEKADVAARRLSGGQQRRLSVAIAFVGGGRLVLLDEPTAGLDVGARRQVWELLRRMSRTRAVLLTTHYMDEVDLLGSRIGMLSRGRLKFSGSSAFLKSRLGVGYQLVVGVHHKEAWEAVDELVSSSVPSAMIESRTSTEVVYRLPEYSAPCFPTLLRAVERGDARGVRGYALTATTLEDVFVRVSEADTAADRAAAAEESIEVIWTCEVYRSLAWSQFKAMLTKRLRCALRDRPMQCLHIISPIVCILTAMLLGLANYSAPQSLKMDFTMFGSEPVSELVTLNCGELWGPSPSAAHVNIVEVKSSLNVSDELDLKDYLADTWHHHSSPRYGAFSCWDHYVDAWLNETKFGDQQSYFLAFRPSVVLLHNTSSHHQAPVNLGTHYNQRLRASPQWNGATMAYTATLLDEPVVTEQMSYIFVLGALALPFMLLSAAGAAWIVKERECGARAMQDVCGLSVPVYWLANFLFDVAQYIAVALVFVAVFAMFRRTDLVGSDRVGGTVTLLVVSGFTNTVYMYCWSFLFRDHGTAQAVITIVNFAVALAMVLVIYVVSRSPELMGYTPQMRFGFRVVPPYCILEGLLSLMTLTTNVRAGVAASAWDMDQLGWPLVYMAAEFPVLWAAVLLADHPRVRRAVGLCGYRRDAAPEVGVDEDSDVEEERRAVYEAQNNGTRADVMRLVDLRKTYGDGTAAVRGVSLSVFASEVLGLLGTNGAGKTTVLSMLCQRVVPSGGSAYVCGYDVVAESAEALACVGCCPQTNATLELLTVEEQMRLYAGVRGIPGDHWERLVAALCSLCMLTPYRGTVTRALSGGNQRKLSVALAMIGGPRVLFLDEPTAGMDPVTRRGVWAAIRRAAGYCSVVLTTHHLEEVERVADVVAIMVRGSVQCIGDAAYLKDKFSRVVEVELVVSAACHCALVERFVRARLAGAVRVAGEGRRVVYHVPCEDGVGELFAVLQAHQAALHVMDYRVSATSIEETFVRVKTMAERRGQGPALHSSEIVAGTARLY